MNDFLSKLQEIYQKTKNRLIVLGVPQNIISFLENGKQSEKLINGAMNAGSIKLDVFLKSQVELSRKRFYEMQRLCLNQTEEFVNKLGQLDLNRSQESFVNLNIGTQDVTPFSLLKTIVETGDQDCDFSVTGTNKFPKTELSIYNVYELASDFKKPPKEGGVIKYKKSKTLTFEKTPNSINPPSKPLQAPSKPLLKTTTLKLNIPSDSTKKADEKAKSSNSFKKGSLRKAKTSLKKSSQNQIVYLNGPIEKYQEFSFTRKTMKSRGIEESEKLEVMVEVQKEVKLNEVTTKASPPKIKSPIVNKVYLQLLAGNGEIKKSIDQYKESYFTFSQRREENEILANAKENRDSTASSDKDTNDGESNKQRNTFVRSCNDLDEDILDLSGQIELKKHYSKDDSNIFRSGNKQELFCSSRVFSSQGKPVKGVHYDRNCLDLRKLNLSENIFFDQNVVGKKNSDKKAKKKSIAPKSSKKQAVNKSFASTELDEFLFPRSEDSLRNPRLGTPQSEDKSSRRPIESFYTFQINLNKSSVKMDERSSETFVSSKRTTVERLMDIQQFKTDSVFSPNPKKSVINMEKFFSERTETFKLTSVK